MFDFLRKVPLFAELPLADLKRLCEMVREVRLPVGQVLFAEGSLGDQAYVIQEGEIEVVKRSAGREVFLALRRPGEMIGEMALLEGGLRMATARAARDSVLLEIGREQLDRLLDSSPSAARVMLRTATVRLRETEAALRQSEKLAQLGRLSAGLAHELNNPASAALRGASHLKTSLGELLEARARVDRATLDTGQREELVRLARAARERAGHPVQMDALDRGDREADFESWLEERGLEEAIPDAIELVGLGYELPDLEALEQRFRGEHLPAVIGWLCAVSSTWSLLEEIMQGTGQIASIVKALKSYVYLDQAPVQAVDIHEGLENTLIILRGKLKKGITVQREFAPDLPRVEAHGSELNQVWTNLIDNAADAIGLREGAASAVPAGEDATGGVPSSELRAPSAGAGQGRIILRTRQDGRWVAVEVEDDGPGVPEEARPQLFTPFFTTKPVGVGTGLGLHLSYNIVQHHGGSIDFRSRPGQTVFVVRLPLDPREPAGQAPADAGPEDAGGI